ncbi:MAG TPA: D-aminoacyl-tRNA deacylase [Acidothermaceae bacterium]|jgi:D-tyrosyl-tRNA(Tyr) deacylase
MRAVVQRVSRARVVVDDETVGELASPGLVVLVGVTHSDTASDAQLLASKLYNLRILEGERSCADLDAPLLVISQFTLYADTAKGRRPSWNAAAPALLAEPIVDAVVDALRALGAEVATGQFGAIMRVELINDGPMTLVIDIDGTSN